MLDLPGIARDNLKGSVGHVVPAVGLSGQPQRAVHILGKALQEPQDEAACVLCRASITCMTAVPSPTEPCEALGTGFLVDKASEGLK